MARKTRQLVADQCYHVINRGNERARVFHSDADYRGFLRVVAEACERLPMRVLAACLMPNHFHLVVRPLGDGELSRWMHWIMTTHVARYRRKYQTIGHVWQGRFKPFLIKQDTHLWATMRYVERNAARAGLVSRAEAWPWGSLHWRVHGRAPVPLAEPPIGLPSNWVERVNEAQTDAELKALRACVNSGSAFGVVAETAV